jgi:hypothetical protein
MLSNSRPSLRAGLLALGVVAAGGLSTVLGCNRDPQPGAPDVTASLDVTAAPVGAAPVILRPGAQGRPALATFETKFGPTDVLDIRRVGGGLACTIRWSGEQGVTTGELSIDRRDVRPGWPGFQAYLRADDGQEFGFLIEWDPAVEGREHIREWTGADRLDLDRSFRDGAIFERYDVNGRQLSVELDEDGNLLGAKAVDTSALRTATLNGNAVGDRLMTLLAQDEFGPWLGRLTVRDRNSGGSGCPRWLSRITQPCAFLKCMFGGGVANPLCHVCVGVSWACWIADVGCALADCD